MFHVSGGSLIELHHFDSVITPVSEGEPLMGGDRLVYAGQIDEIMELKKSHGLVNADHHVFSMKEIDDKRLLRTAYVNFGSAMIGKNIDGSTFEKDNNMTLVAVARRGERINELPRQVVLKAGDSLLLECAPDQNVDSDSLASHLCFFDSSQVVNMGYKTLVSAVVMLAMVTLSALGVMSLLQCAVMAPAATASVTLCAAGCR